MFATENHQLIEREKWAVHHQRHQQQQQKLINSNQCQFKVWIPNKSHLLNAIRGTEKKTESKQ